MTAASEHVLLRFRAGDTEAFAQLMRDYSGKVRNIVARYFRGVFDQDEALQEIWMHLYKNREALDPQRLQEFDAWLGTMARRKCLDQLRKRGRTLPLTDSEHHNTLEATMLSPDATLIQEDIVRAVETFKNSLEGEWRTFFQLHFVEARTYKDIAKELGCNTLRCKYMKKVIASRAKKNRTLLEALGRWRTPSEEMQGES